MLNTHQTYSFEAIIREDLLKDVNRKRGGDTFSMFSCSHYSMLPASLKL
jgi:hypothetical protein